jgi:dihydroflavonol-4-reductase
MNKTTYLLTGAAGFLGGNIARQLLERGDSVRAFVLKNDPAIRFVPAECDVFEGDLTDKDSLRPFFEVPEGTETVCLHIASVVTVDPDYNPLVMNVNVGGTQNIIVRPDRALYKVA